MFRICMVQKYKLTRADNCESRTAAGPDDCELRIAASPAANNTGLARGRCCSRPVLQSSGPAGVRSCSCPVLQLSGVTHMILMAVHAEPGGGDDARATA